MRKKEASFWSEIKSLDERLAKDPDSYCFARLSEVYLKVGLIADALHTARTGIARHPNYLAGQRALAMACHASGLHDECRSALEQVTRAIPEDVDALKVLAHLYAEKGDDEAAISTYRTLLEFKPEDMESVAQLDALLEGGENVVRTYLDEDLDTTDFPVHTGHEAEPDKESDEDEIHELKESDIVYDEPVVDEPTTAALFADKPTVTEQHDPLSTATLAELYVQQGLYAKALYIYRSILDTDPLNDNIRAKIDELEARDTSGYCETDQDLTSDSGEYEYEPEQIIFSEPDETLVAFEPLISESVVEIAPEMPETAPQPEFKSEPEALPTALFEVSSASVEPATVPFAPLQNQMADNVVNTLDSWLENIRRIKACR